jgi:phage-related protein
MKKVYWIGSSYKDFMEFSPEVRHAMGYALFQAQMGKKHERTKVLSGKGNAGVAEVRENDANGTYRVVYTVEMKDHVFVLHAFQKKSKSGIATPKQELVLISKRIKEAKALYVKIQEGANSENKKN